VSCEDCERARASFDWKRYDLKCVYCGARYIAELNTWPRRLMGDGFKQHEETREERKAWRQKVVDDWTAYGHAEAQLLQLATAGKVPFEPVTKRGEDDERKSSKAGVRGARAAGGKAAAQGGEEEEEGRRDLHRADYAGEDDSL
jgi:hypothetical protein